MNSVPKILEKVIKKYPDFEYYNLHLDKIENNIDKNPDISIEACKSLIEGISKSILNRIDNTFDEKKETTGRNPKTVQQLFKRALEKIAENNMKFEPGFIHSSGQIINVTSEIRTERGDISHGKSVPKKVSSTPSFARLISNMTDLTVSYVLEHFIEIDLDYRNKLDYNTKEIKLYNDWLDENVEGFPIKKAKYSQLLYENDYDEYENIYYSDYLRSKDSELDEKLEQKIIIPIETEKIKTELHKPKVSVTRKVQELTNTFDEQQFWTDPREKEFAEFCEQFNLIQEATKQVIEDYLAFSRTPRRDEAIEIMNSKPPLKDIKEVGAELIARIVDFTRYLSRMK